MTPTTVPPKVKVFWTEEEVEAIAQQVALLRLDSNYLNCSLTPLVAAAQLVLPEGRRRHIASFSQVASDFEERVAVHLKSLMNRPPEVKIVEKEVPKVEYVKTEPADAVREVTAGTLLDELLRRLTEQMGALVMAMQRPEEAKSFVRAKLPPEEPKEPEAVKPVGPTVLVLGLPHINFIALQNRLKPQGIRLRYVDAASGKNERIPSGANYVVVSANGKFVTSHKWTHSAIALYGRERVFTVPGRVKQAEDAILALVARGDIPSAPVNGKAAHA
jgi:hypothetical protein